MGIEEKLLKLNIVLPDVNKPTGSFVPAILFENILFSSGQLPRIQGVVSDQFTGKMGDNIPIEQGYEAARLCAINLLAAVKNEVGSLEKVERIVKLNGYINATSDFIDTTKVMNGASDLLLDIFGEKGKHARSAVGVQSLPFNAICEVEMIVQLKD